MKKVKLSTGFLACLYLKIQGKKDGKRSIPSVIKNNEFMSPNLKKEHDRVSSFMANVICAVDEINAVHYQELQMLIIQFSANVSEAVKINNQLKDMPSELSLYVPKYTLDKEFDDFLNSKHNSESNLDEMALRQRRFNEYQQRLAKLRERFSYLRVEITTIYKKIAVCCDTILRNITVLESMFLKAKSEIDIRVSWYWQGVLLKHPDSDKLPSTAQEPDFNQYVKYYSDRNNEIDTIKNSLAKEYETYSKL